jgi:hypothetical protein
LSKDRAGNQVVKRLCFILFLLSLTGSSFCQWVPQNSNTTSNLRDIHFLNDSVGFVVGSNGAFLKTTDRGENWQYSVINASQNLNSVYAIDEDTIFAGSYSFIYKTTDGGQNWNIINSTLSVNELKFFSSQVGYAKASWEEECPYPNQGSTYRYKYFRTLDGGNNWTYFSLFEDHTVSSAEMEIINADTGFMGAMEMGFWCGYYPCCESASNYFFKTTDGGLTWQEIDSWFGGGALSDVAFRNGMDGFAVREHPTPYGNTMPADLYRISNGGSVISLLSAMPDYTIRKFFFASEFEGYYLSGKNIMKTTTEGMFWQEDYEGNQTLSDLVMTKNFEAYAIGYGGTILHKELNPANEPEPLFWMSCDQDKLAFPKTNINDTSVLEFDLKASGNQDITVDILGAARFLVKTSGDENYAGELTGLLLPAGHDTTIMVAFTPQAYSNCADTVVISGNATNNPVVRLPVTGKGVCYLPPSIASDTVFCYDSVWVRSHVTVDQGSTMYFCPGTVVFFEGGFQLNVQGTLTAVGTPIDSIRFTCENKWGGIFITGDNPSDSVIMEYCRIAHSNRDIWPATDNGGAVNIDGIKHVTVRNSSFLDCGADDNGGAIFCTGQGLTVSHCKFFQCGAGNGGAAYATNIGKRTFSDCVFENCGADSGGGVFITCDVDSVLVNCSFTDCSADYGAALYLAGNLFSIHSCTVSNCTAYAQGGGIYAGTSGPSLIDHIEIEECNASEGGGIFVGNAAELTIDHCKIMGCESGLSGGGISTFAPYQLQIRNCYFVGDRVTDGNGGAIYLDTSSPVITGCDISYCFAYGGSGGAIYCNNSSPAITGNIIHDNNSDAEGAGVFMESNLYSIVSVISQNLFYRNLASYGNAGGGIYLSHSSSDIIFNTITENNSGGIYCQETMTTRIFGNIVYNNSMGEIITNNAVATIASYNDVKNGWNGNGTGNINADPLFYGLPYYPWYWINIDYSVMPGSPCIDAGIENLSIFEIPPVDLAGNPRVTGGRMDIGAYECNFLYQPIDTGFCEGLDYLLEVIPINTSSFSSYWTFNGTPIPGASGNQYLLEDPADSDEGYYQCILAGENYTLYSRVIYLYDKGLAPEVQEQPVGAVLNEGDDYWLVFAVYSPDNATTYQWYLNEAIIPGEDEREIYITDFSKAKVGIYKCLAENTCGGIYSDDAVLQLAPSDIAEQGSKESGKRGGLVVWPNPASGQLTVDSRQESSVVSRQSSVGFEICDVYGRSLIKPDQTSPLPMTIDVSKLSPGMYILQVTTDDGQSATTKFLKIRE